MMGNNSTQRGPSDLAGRDLSSNTTWCQRGGPGNPLYDGKNNPTNMPLISTYKGIEPRFDI